MSIVTAQEATYSRKVEKQIFRDRVYIFTWIESYLEDLCTKLLYNIVYSSNQLKKSCSYWPISHRSYEVDLWPPVVVLPYTHMLVFLLLQTVIPETLLRRFDKNGEIL